MSTAFEFLNQQLGLYREQAEGWKPGHVEAMRCRDIEDAIRYGLFLLETRSIVIAVGHRNKARKKVALRSQSFCPLIGGAAGEPHS